MTMLPPTMPPPTGPEAWPTELAKPDEPAGPRSQVAVYAVCAFAMVIVCGAGNALEWGVAGALALGAGVAIGVATDLRRAFRTVPGAIAAAVAMMVTTVLLAFVSSDAILFSLVPLIGAFVLGLDWRLVRRLRLLPFAFGFLVVIGVAGGQTWTYPAGLLWLAGALGALASLEADRRIAQPQVLAVTTGPEAPEVRTGDLATTILVAFAVALLAALVLSTPSCQRTDQSSGRNGEGTSESGGSSSGGSGAGEQGSGGTGGGQGSGSEQGSGGSGHLYVPDPNGQFLIPNDGSGSTGEGTGVPSPTLLPGVEGELRSQTLDDGTRITAERLPDGTGRITVTDPDGTTRTYTYRDRSDGLTEIQETDENGDPTGRPLYYDPEGKLATDDTGAVDGSSGSGAQPVPEEQEKDTGDRSHLDGRLLALIVAVLAALGGLAWWLSRRKPPEPASDLPPAPPWAIALARQIERDGAARGRTRTRAQTLGGYAGVVQRDVLPDPRVTEVADVVSTALFARRDPGPEAQQWAESTWAAITAAHPAPSRSEKRRAAASAP